ncbi:UNVERIFIED_CONTAM: hypothetical protein RMT77_013770 [Armadillidium vulgare]
MASCLKSLSQRKTQEYDWVDHKFKFMRLSLDEKRNYYRYKEFKTVGDIPRWSKDFDFGQEQESDEELEEEEEEDDEPEQGKGQQKQEDESVEKEEQAQEQDFSYDEVFQADPALNNKIGIFFGRLEFLEVDAVVIPCDQHLDQRKEKDKLPPSIVNCTNYIVIHEEAGQYLRNECDSIKVCPPGEARITGGYLLPAKYVIHTNAPTIQVPDPIENCYVNSLRLALENNIKTIAFPCISTGGTFGYPQKETAHRVLRSVRRFLDIYYSRFELIVFCLTAKEEKKTYKEVLPRYFPL